MDLLGTESDKLTTKSKRIAARFVRDAHLYHLFGSNCLSDVLDEYILVMYMKYGLYEDRILPDMIKHPYPLGEYCIEHLSNFVRIINDDENIITKGSIDYKHTV